VVKGFVEDFESEDHHGGSEEGADGVEGHNGDVHLVDGGRVRAGRGDEETPFTVEPVVTIGRD